MTNQQFDTHLQPLTFDKNRRRVLSCPCGKNNKDGKFAPYVGFDTKGFCHSCGNTFLPDIQDHITQPIPYNVKSGADKILPHSLIPNEDFKASLRKYESNNFVIYLNTLFGPALTKELIEKYHVGTSRYWPGSTVFYQIDLCGNIRTGKIMLYNPVTGKRVKEPYNHITWTHQSLKMPGFNLKQCFFGEHLLAHSEKKRVAIVESEKTAIIASAYFPQFIWIAVGSISNLNADRCQILKNRIVVLFPDLNAYPKWKFIAEDLSHITTFIISDLLERKATQEERAKGLDLADYLVNYDRQSFNFASTKDFVDISKEDISNTNLYFESATKTGSHELVRTIPEPHEKQKAWMNRELENWDDQVYRLESFFHNRIYPEHTIMIGPEPVSNCKKWVEVNLETVKANMGNKTFRPYLNRLEELKRILQSERNPIPFSSN